MNDAVQPILRDVLRQGVALPLETLVLRMRRRGAVVNEGLLERTLRAGGSGARVIDPWQGPHAALRFLLPSEAGAGSRGPWVVPDEAPDGMSEAGGGGPTGVCRVLRSLGRELDERSPRDIARWIGLVEEARRLRPPAA